MTLRGLSRIGITIIFSLTILVIVRPGLAQQLDESRVTNILNRTVPVEPDGERSLLNVPSIMGQVRSRASCIRDGLTISEQTDFFTIVRNGVTRTCKCVFGQLDQPPASLSFVPSVTSVLFEDGSSLSFSVIATFPDASTRDVTATNSSINYASTNTAVVTVDANGGVIVVSSGRVLITACLDEAVTIKQLTVVTAEDRDKDRLPDDYELATDLNPKVQGLYCMYYSFPLSSRMGFAESCGINSRIVSLQVLDCPPYL